MLAASLRSRGASSIFAICQRQINAATISWMLSVVATRCLQNKFDEANARFARIRTLSHSHAQHTQFLMMNFIFGEEKEMLFSLCAVLPPSPRNYAFRTRFFWFSILIPLIKNLFNLFTRQRRLHLVVVRRLTAKLHIRFSRNRNETFRRESEGGIALKITQFWQGFNLMWSEGSASRSPVPAFDLCARLPLNPTRCRRVVYCVLGNLRWWFSLRCFLVVVAFVAGSIMKGQNKEPKRFVLAAMTGKWIQAKSNKIG